ncbi:MAG: tRNA pseudouridine(38-40) synthase TruA [Deltaproteobacteria bacterium]|nr:tRNA pseudouridine(38-40) synthase TruA [Deltaproteobacteria bacterium]
MPKMRTVKLSIQYDGTDYFGWQMQARHRSVQQVLQEALGIVCNHPVTLHGSGRTDTGVHALGQVAHFKTSSAIDMAQLQKGLNSLLPDDVVVREAVEAHPDFHARFDATARTYWYFILNEAVPSVFYRRYAWHVRKPLDVAAMRTAAALLVGMHDYSSFQAREREGVCMVREVKRVRLKRVGPLLLFEIQATSFLRHMVRGIVGTLVEIGLGKLGAAAMQDILLARDRSHAGPTAPARGLFLKEVRYD